MNENLVKIGWNCKQRNKTVCTVLKRRYQVKCTLACICVTLAGLHYITLSGCNRVMASIESRLGVTVVFSQSRFKAQQLGLINISIHKADKSL